MRIIASIIVGLLLIFALGSALRAQTPAQDPVIRLCTNLVEIDAVVTDAEGRPARLLRQRFRSSETLRYRACLYGLRAVNEGRPKLQIQAIIRRGKTVTASTAPRLARPEATAVSAIGGDLAPIGLAPGVYALELIIADLDRQDAPLSITAEFEIEAR